MIPAVLFFTVIILALLEFASRREDIRNLYIHFALDTKLAEPGETVTLRYTVRNNGVFPILYAGLSMRLDTAFSPEEDSAAFFTAAASMAFTPATAEISSSVARAMP